MFLRRWWIGLAAVATVTAAPDSCRIGEAALAATVSDRLFEAGVFAQGIGFPTVARDAARLRTIVSATHTRDDLQFALDALGRVGRELGVL